VYAKKWQVEMEQGSYGLNIGVETIIQRGWNVAAEVTSPHQVSTQAERMRHENPKLRGSVRW